MEDKLEPSMIACPVEPVSAKRSFLSRLGPGLITGASDDDPSGIASYSQAGAAFGYGLLWTMVLSLPLMAAIQEINAASIRERIYANLEGESPMSGILLYTAAADSDGTLGGLVELGKPNNLGRLIQQALYRATICSSDPLCSEHNPEQDRSLHAASCHACGFVSETSCERGNRYLDRALLIPTFDSRDAAFFARTEVSNG